ncbi:MAG TPA: hypothetical protein PKY64_08845 [Anaerolineaceae bacterium]|nr:hypothetical protein [Anaerolineaceae bacterium]
MTEALTFPSTSLGYYQRMRLSETESVSRPDFLRSLRQVTNFTRVFGGIKLRAYQQAAANAIVNSVLHNLGLSVVVMFPRQSGKNLMQAQLEVYLMALLAEEGAEMVKLSPTYQPQSLNAMRRLETALEANFLTRGKWHKSAGNHYRFHKSHLTFLSAAPSSNIVGATASTLLSLDEAQDIEIAKYDKQIAPMAASTNATRVFWGTAWSAQTLLARELRAAREAEARDSIRRVFQITAEEVRREVPAYGTFVDEQIARMGRSHPMVRSQFFSEEIDFAAGLFNPSRLGLMQGAQPALETPMPGKRYALLIDLAGEDEALRQGGANTELENPDRDLTAVTVVELDFSLLGEDLVGKPIYRVVNRQLWQGERHSTLYARLLRLAELWQPEKIVVDASGVGAGVGSFLRDKLGERVITLQFTRQLKSRLGWGFLAVVDTGRFQDFSPRSAPNEWSTNPLLGQMAAEQDRLQALFYRQLAGLQAEVSPGPERLLRWSVPEGARDPEGGLLHDDLVLSAAMVAVLDELSWGVSSQSVLIPASDPILEMDGGF